jgi:GTP cyclohydrolase II
LFKTRDPPCRCLTGDVFGSQRCDCGPQLRESVERIAAVGGYLRQEGRGIGLYAKLDAYALQDGEPDEADRPARLGITISGLRRNGVFVSPANAGYLRAKVAHTSHTLDLAAAS